MTTPDPRLRLVGRRILLVEDTPTDQRLLATFLTRMGADVTLECNGQAAVDRIYPRRGGSASFDAILMDLLMTPVDGAEAAATLRRCGFASPILILTSSGDPADERRCRLAGCDRFLAKPIRYDDLLDALVEGIAARTQARTA